ncbi:MAG: phosphogluconate dehydratase [Rhodospirillales bacterium]|nr:phosphogluconate dehydratase [Rhodospirillales bacterium]
MAIHPALEAVTRRIQERSRETRATYLARLEQARSRGPVRGHLSCTNLAHAFAAFAPAEKCILSEAKLPNIGIVSAYNDMLSAHQPLQFFPEVIKRAAREAGGVAQFAGGVPAMCDGVTQGEPGMELSLFSRDVIAMATAVSLSHNTFDAALCIGICDKIVPGLLIGALAFGHLPTIMVPGGPMPSGLPNQDKAKVRQLFVQGKVGRDELLEAESRAYHAPGTCTFYGTANSNQMLMEVMGLHMPGTAFINPYTPLRDALTDAAARRVLQITALGDEYIPVGRVVDERAISNGIVGLLATGGSTNHTIHLVAIARAAGILIDWDDFADLSAVVPLIAKVYPNGAGDVNDFHKAGGMGFLIAQLLDAGLLHDDVLTIAGHGLKAYRQQPFLNDGRLSWHPAPAESEDESILRPVSRPFAPDGGLKVLEGNLGRAVIKTSAVRSDRHVIEAPAIVFNNQQELMAAFDRGELQRDFVAVVRWQGPRANGMPELHKLTPPLGVLQDDGYKVALVTDGRMSGASGKVPAAIHVSPECAAGGPLAKIRTGDVIRLDARSGTLDARISADELARRPVDAVDLTPSSFGLGRELFATFRNNAASAEQGAMTWLPPEPPRPPASTDIERERVHDHFVYVPETMR